MQRRYKSERLRARELTRFSNVNSDHPALCASGPVPSFPTTPPRSLQVRGPKQSLEPPYGSGRRSRRVTCSSLPPNLPDGLAHKGAHQLIELALMVPVKPHIPQTSVVGEATYGPTDAHLQPSLVMLPVEPISKPIYGERPRSGGLVSVTLPRL